MSKFFPFLFVSLCVVVFISCSNTRTENVIQITAKDFRFEIQDSIPSGWNTFKFVNAGHAEHFFLLDYLPDSVSFERYYNEVVKPFDFVYDSLKAGVTKERAGELLGTTIPAWYFTDVKQMGGSGIVSMHQSTQVTLNLKPGRYAIECYIKEKGVFHTAYGMLKELTVTNEVSNTKEPKADIDMTLTNFKYDITGTPKPGINRVAVHFKEHPQFTTGNDVHLIELTDSTDMNTVIDWLDWMNIQGMEPPAPVTFLGGTQEMPIGYTSYFTVDFKPGKYAWISESTASKGMVSTFEVK